MKTVRRWNAASPAVRRWAIRLQETNDELDAARGAAEEAKHFRGQFLANMSHELRTPLNAIIGFSETMLKFPAMYDDVKLPVAYEADLQQIYTSGRQLLTLINDILDLAKVDAGKLDVRMERVDLSTVFEQRRFDGERVGRQQADPAGDRHPRFLPAVWADEARVRQVLLNLYSNAAKFTDQRQHHAHGARNRRRVCKSACETAASASPQENLGRDLRGIQAGGNRRTRPAFRCWLGSGDFAPVD